MNGFAGDAMLGTHKPYTQIKRLRGPNFFVHAARATPPRSCGRDRRLGARMRAALLWTHVPRKR